jgi:hypothetical protein
MVSNFIIFSLLTFLLKILLHVMPKRCLGDLTLSLKSLYAISLVSYIYHFMKLTPFMDIAFFFFQLLEYTIILYKKKRVYHNSFKISINPNSTDKNIKIASVNIMTGIKLPETYLLFIY